MQPADTISWEEYKKEMSVIRLGGSPQKIANGIMAIEQKIWIQILGEISERIAEFPELGEFFGEDRKLLHKSSLDSIKDETIDIQISMYNYSIDYKYKDDPDFWAF
jgi:hypothetical protein